MMLKATNAIVAENRYGLYCVPPKAAERPAAQKILHGQVWEPQTIAFIVSSCADRSIVHAGAFFGDFLPALSKALSPGAMLIAAEPNAENFACAEWTTRVNALNNVRLFAGALGEVRSTTELIVKDARGESLGGWSRVKGPSQQIVPERLVAVDVETIDHLCEGADVGVIHLDVEGYETLALEGAMHTIHRCKPILIVETRPLDSWIEANLAPLGYTAAGFVHSNAIYAVA